MLLGRVTMSTHALHVEATVRGAKIGGDDGPCCTGDAPPPVEVRVLLMALELEVGVADLATLEESLAKSYDGHAITPLRRSSYPHTLPTEENLVETVDYGGRRDDIAIFDKDSSVTSELDHVSRLAEKGDRAWVLVALDEGEQMLQHLPSERVIYSPSPACLPGPLHHELWLLKCLKKN